MDQFLSVPWFLTFLWGGLLPSPEVSLLLWLKYWQSLCPCCCCSPSCSYLHCDSSGVHTSSLLEKTHTHGFNCSNGVCTKTVSFLTTEQRWTIAALQIFWTAAPIIPHYGLCCLCWKPKLGAESQKRQGTKELPTFAIASVSKQHSSPPIQI